MSEEHKSFLRKLDLKRELDRLATYSCWHIIHPGISPVPLARSGLYYLGDLGRTKCFSCEGVLEWSIGDDVEAKHATLFPTCKITKGRETKNVAVRSETEMERRVRYPHLFSASPNMVRKVDREETFRELNHIRDDISTSANEFSDAGFFFSSEDNIVKCWYCDCELQNCKLSDDPWQAHAKQSPICEFLLRKKGQVFVHQLFSTHLEQHSEEFDSARSDEIDIPSDESGNESSDDGPPPIIIDPQEEMRKKKERIENIMKTSEICKHILLFGFSKDVVRQVLYEQIYFGNEANLGGICKSASALLDVVKEKESEMRREAEEKEARREAEEEGRCEVPSTNLPSLTGSSIGPAFGSGKYNVPFYDEDEPMGDQNLHESISGASSMSGAITGGATGIAPVKQIEDSSESLQEQLHKLMDERMCKICFSNVADMVFVPCGHMCCCMDCTQAIRKCPVCRTKIEKAIRGYMK